MNILAIGDLTEPRAVPFLQEKLDAFCRENHVSFVVANGENAGFIMGPTPDLAEKLRRAGVDCVTGGNHTLQNKFLYTMLENDIHLLRPQNYPPSAPGRGYTILNADGYRLLIVNVLGQVHMEPVLDNPFFAVDRVLQRESGNYDIAILDIHAEATGEKLALAHYFDGRISVIFGTHTHIPTADEQILPNGSGYVTDLGMCGGSTGILGVKKEVVIERMTTRLPVKSEPDNGPMVAYGAIFTVDPDTGRCTAVKRVTLH